MSGLAGQRIVLGVTGGIAAYKAADLARRLQDAGAELQVVMTEGAQQFVTPMTFQALTGRPVRSSLWDAAAEAAMGHIELARWADRILIAPASADIIARLAHGLAGDLLTTICLASDAPLALAPAMNRRDVGASGDPGQYRDASRPRRAVARTRRRRPGLWRSRRRPDAGTAADRRRARRRRRPGFAGRPPGDGQRRPNLRGPGSGSLPRQPQLREDGFRAGRGSRPIAAPRSPWSPARSPW